MEKEEIKNRFEETAQDLFEYGKLQVDGLKLRLLESLSTLFDSVFTAFVLLFLGTIALLFVAVTLMLVLAELTGSLLLSAAIMTGVLILLIVIIYVRREKLFIDMIVRMLSKLLFEKEKE
jgi:hypothetical protein